MNTFKKQNTQVKYYLKLLLLLTVGGAVFYSSSLTNLNYLFRGYLALIEIQTAIFIILLTTGRLNSKTIVNK